MPWKEKTSLLRKDANGHPNIGQDPSSGNYGKARFRPWLHNHDGTCWKYLANEDILYEWNQGGWFSHASQIKKEDTMHSIDFNNNNIAAEPPLDAMTAAFVDSSKHLTITDVTPTKYKIKECMACSLSH
eukprot:5092807-Ditylum_brightwellii.AAC.1